MTSDYMNRGPMLAVMDDYLRQTIGTAGEYMAAIRRVRAIELFGLLDLSQIKDCYRVLAKCELEAAHCLVGHAYVHHLIDVEDYYAIDRILNRFGLSDQEGMS